MTLPSRAPALALEPAPQTACDSESWPDANLLCWPYLAFEEARFCGLHGNFRERADDPPRYPRLAVRSLPPDNLAWTSHRPVIGRHPLRRHRDCQRIAPAPWSKSRQTSYDRPEPALGCASSLPGQLAR